MNSDGDAVEEYIESRTELSSQPIDYSIRNRFIKVGVFVDLANISRGGQKVRMDVLRRFAEMWGQVIRLNAYLSYDAERAEEDFEYRERALNYQEMLRGFGFHTIVKEVKWYYDPETNRRVGKANVDVEMAVDLVLQAGNLDIVLLLTGDGDFVRAVQALRNTGRRVILVGFDNVSRALREEVDAFTSGYIIPDLVPATWRSGGGPAWGDVGSTVRGVCYWHHSEESYGYLSYLREMSTEMWLFDPRHKDSPFEAAFFHDSALPPEINPRNLPSRRYIFEFEIAKNERGIYATNIRLISRL